MTLSVWVEYYRLTYILWVIDHIQPAKVERLGPWASCVHIQLHELREVCMLIEDWVKMRTELICRICIHVR